MSHLLPRKSEKVLFNFVASQQQETFCSEWRLLAHLQLVTETHDKKYIYKYLDEEKLFELISLLINSLSFKSAVSQIREILKGSPKVANSQNLLQNIINLMTFFKYKHESRKSILNIFEEILKSPDFNSEVGGKITFFVHDEKSLEKLKAPEPESDPNFKKSAPPEKEDKNCQVEQ